MEQGLIHTKSLAIGYGKRDSQTVIAKDINFALKRGELTLLIGENGTGKSTLLRTISGVQPPLSGNIYLNNKNINKLSNREIAKYISIVFTDKSNAGGLTVEEIVTLGRYPYTNLFGQTNQQDREIVEESLASVGMINMRSRFASQLSDGERQKVMIAKALAQQTDIIMLDEPTAFLDLPSKIETLYLLKQLAITKQKVIILSTHDIEQSLSTADNILLFKNKTVEHKTITQIAFSDGLKGIFNNNRVEFNAEQGRFTPTPKSNLKVYIDTPTKLRYFIEGGVLASGATISNNKPDSNIELICKTESNTITLKHKEDKTITTLNNITQLTQYLTQLQNSRL